MESSISSLKSMMHQLLQAAERGEWGLLSEKERDYRQQLNVFLEQVKREKLMLRQSDIHEFYTDMDALTALCRNGKRELARQIGGANQNQKQVRAYLGG